MNKKIWLSSPHMSGREQDYIKEAFDQNWIAPLGPNVNGFEDDLRSYFNQNVDVAALSAGTAAVHLALIQLGVGQGDEVICQSLTFSASANPIVYMGATPIFVDSEQETWNISPEIMEEAIKDRIKNGVKPKAIVAVHLYGMPYKVEEIQEIADRYEIPVIEDAAEALGSTYKGEKCGSFGHFGVLSFNGNKIITTSGGGALVCHTRKEREETIFLSTQARDDAPHYQHSRIGYNYRMSNIVAGIGRGQMEILSKRVDQKRGIYNHYYENFADRPGLEFHREPENMFSNRWLSTILVHPEENNGITREDIRMALKEDNIESRPLWKPMHLQPVFEKYPYYGGTVSETLFENGLCLPSGTNMEQNDINRVIKGLKTVL